MSDTESEQYDHVLVLRDEDGEMYQLYLTEELHDKAAKDMSYASRLLTKHKQMINRQLMYVQQTDMVSSSNYLFPNDFTPLKLQENDVFYNLLVTKEEADRACKDIIFATNLLEQHKQQCFNMFAHSNNENLPCSEEDTPAQSDHDEQLEDLSNGKNMPESTGKKTKKKVKGEGRCVWGDEDVLLLLSIYQENQKSYDEGKLTSKKFWKIIMNGIKSKGCSKSRNQCMNKIENLKKMYKKVHDHNAQSGNDPITCDYYDILDELFSKKPWINPLSVAGSSIPLSDININNGSTPCKKMRTELNEAKIKFLNDAIRHRQLKREETAEYRKKKVNVLKDIADVLKKKFN